VNSKHYDKCTSGVALKQDKINIAR